MHSTERVENEKIDESGSSVSLGYSTGGVHTVRDFFISYTFIDSSLVRWRQDRKSVGAPALFFYLTLFRLANISGGISRWDCVPIVSTQPTIHPPTQRTHTQCRWLQFSVTFGVAPSSSTRLLSLSYTGIIERGPSRQRNTHRKR